MDTHDVRQSWLLGPTEPPLKNQTIPQLLQETVNQFGDREAVVFARQNIRLSYKELSCKVDQLAKGLAELGLKKGDRIGIWSQNRLEWVLTQFATARLGLIMVNINPSCRYQELHHILSQVGCRAIILSERSQFTDYLSMACALIPQLFTKEPLSSSKYPELEFVIRMGRGKTGQMINFDDVQLSGKFSHIDLDEIGKTLDPYDPINIQFTSGTTGQPKGATLSHFNIINNAINVTGRMQFTEADRLCIPVPLYHCFGMVMGVLGCTSKGAAMIFPAESFAPRTTLSIIERERCTAIYGVPAMYIAMLDVPGFTKYTLTSLRTGIMAGSPCPIEVMKEVVERMHLSEITIAYGMTETSPVSFQSTVTDSIEKRVSSVGTIHPHLQVKLVDANGTVVPRGEVGELWTAGYSVMSGYWGDKAGSTDVIVDGWMRTGDLGIVDEEGYCAIVGRLSDMVLRGGENIYPREIENFLHTHPAVQDVQVFGIPDARAGEELCAWIILHKDQDSIDENDIRNFCRDKIASYKIPQTIRFVDELPLSVTGKPQKYKMRAAMCEELGLINSDI